MPQIISQLSSANLALLVLAAVMLTMLGVTLKILEKGKRDTGDLTQPWPLYRRSVLSPVEQVLYFRLMRALPENVVLAQVQLSRLLGVKKGVPRLPWLNRIDRLSVDFVVCSRGGHPMAAIELDDGSPERPDRVATDAKKSHALRSAGLALVRWHVMTLPDATAIRAALANCEPGAPVQRAARRTHDAQLTDAPSEVPSCSVSRVAAMPGCSSAKLSSANAAAGGFLAAQQLPGPSGLPRPPLAASRVTARAPSYREASPSGVPSVEKAQMRTFNLVCAVSMGVLLAACGQLPEFMTPRQEAPGEQAAPAPAPMQFKPLQVVQRIGKFGFCSECPAVTAKRVFLAVNATSEDAAERALSRLRDAMGKRAPAAKTGEGALIEQVSATNAKGKDPWVIFALIGDPTDAAMQKALETVVVEFKGSSFHLLAEPSQDAQLAAFQGLLRKSGIPDAMMTASIVQAEHRVDAAVAVPGTKDLATIGRPKMLVIRN